MALRDMKCRTCGKTTEHLIGVHEPDPTKCTECGADEDKGLERDLTPPSTSFQLKGKGWFRDGY